MLSLLLSASLPGRRCVSLWLWGLVYEGGDKSSSTDTSMSIIRVGYCMINMSIQTTGELTITNLLNRPSIELIKPTFLMNRDVALSYPPKEVHTSLFNLHTDVRGRREHW